MRTRKTGAAVVQRRPMSLAGRKPLPPRATAKPYTFRCPADVLAYIRREHAEHGRTQTDVIVRAVGLDRDLSLKLGAQEPRMEHYAHEHGLSYETELAEVVAQLVRYALDCWERETETPDRRKK